MSRASVASTSARAGDRPVFACLGRARFGRAREAGRRLLASIPKPYFDPERLARWGVPLALALFVAILFSISFSFTFAEQDRIVVAAMSDVEMAAAVIADDIDLRRQAAPEKTPADALAAAVPHHAFKPGLRILLSDPDGTVIAAYPEDTPKGTIADHLGGAQPLTIFAEKAGAMRMTLPSGEDVLATVHSLREPPGQITVLHPMDEVLSDWRAGLYRTTVLLGTTAAVLAALAFAYLFQATKARQADTSCRMMQDRVDMVLSRGRCGLWDWNLATGAVDWSMSMFEILGMSVKPKSFAEIKELVHPDDSGFEAMAQTLSSGTQGTIDHVFRMRNAKGDWVWLRAKAELVNGAGAAPHLVGIAVDVTETIALEERTARADMRLRDALETISEAFVVWDAQNRLVMCNSKFQRFHNLPSEAVAVGTPYTEVMERGTAPLIQSQIVLGETLPLGARTFEAQLGDGRWLQINERRTKDGGYVSVGTDITTLKRNEEQLIDSETELRRSIDQLNASYQELEAQKHRAQVLSDLHLEQKGEAEKANRAKSDFLANMGHELRTPLNAILGFSEVMMMEHLGPLGSPIYAGYCNDIHTSGQYLLRVIADVLEMSRLDAGRVRLEKQDFPVEDAIESAVMTVGTAAEAAQIAIEMEPAGDTLLNADRTAVEKILTIVLNNAVKYTPAHGRVTVRTRAVQGAMNIYVEDTGVGIPLEAQARLGRPFEQSEQDLRNGMRGSGLGLAIARSLVDLHGGKLSIRSQEGVGTLVHVNLPNRRPAPPKLAIAASGGRSSARAARFTLQAVERSAKKISRTA